MDRAELTDRGPQAMCHRRPRSLRGTCRPARPVPLTERCGEVFDQGVELGLVPVGAGVVAVGLGLVDLCLKVADALLVAAACLGVDHVTGRRLHSDADEIEAMDLTAVRFDEVLGAGAWEALPAGFRAAIAANAHTFAGMLEDPSWDQPAASLYAHASCRTIHGAGHSPHLTHPAEFGATLRAFVTVR